MFDSRVKQDFHSFLMEGVTVLLKLQILIIIICLHLLKIFCENFLTQKDEIALKPLLTLEGR